MNETILPAAAGFYFLQVWGLYGSDGHRCYTRVPIVGWRCTDKGAAPIVADRPEKQLHVFAEAIEAPDGTTKILEDCDDCGCYESAHSFLQAVEVADTDNYEKKDA